LVPPPNAREKKNVTHCFKVTLGDCKVTRDVKIIHHITANLDHHIKEHVICKHNPCTKYTSEDLQTVKDGKCCDIKFPEINKFPVKDHKFEKICNDTTSTVSNANCKIKKNPRVKKISTNISNNQQSFNANVSDDDSVYSFKFKKMNKKNKHIK